MKGYLITCAVIAAILTLCGGIVAGIFGAIGLAILGMLVKINEDQVRRSYRD